MSNPVQSSEPTTFLFSIIVPTFRREKYLPLLFDAVARQIDTQVGPVELVLVDNSREASARVVASAAPGFVRYIHEPRTGVAHARNRGVAEARGTHLIFLDDDETPDAGWLAAFVSAAKRGEGAAFGSIEPAFEEAPPDALLAPLERVFSRRIRAGTGDNIGHLRAYLGSGNSMFHRDVLGLESPPFDTAFDGGGEDVWLFRRLVERHGVILTWCPEARVQEIVPKQRASLDFLRKRRFSDGQLRCIVESGRGGVSGAARVAVWMSVGGAQLVLHGLAAAAVLPVSAAASTRFQLAAVGGAGKLLWWRRRLRR